MLQIFNFSCPEIRIAISSMKSIFKLEKKKIWAIFFASFGFLFITTSIAAFIVFFGISFIRGNIPFESPVYVYDGYFGYSLREIAEHPFDFLLSISFFLALSGAFWVAFFAPYKKRYHSLQALAVPWIAVILTSPVWGLIWSINRWPPGYFTDPDVMMLFYRHDISVGLTLGWLSAIISFPINLVSYSTVYGLLLIAKRLFLQKSANLLLWVSTEFSPNC
jgi:hypothetical protein